MVWDHGRVPAADDQVVEGIDECTAFAEAINMHPDEFISVLPEANPFSQIPTTKADGSQTSRPNSALCEEIASSLNDKQYPIPNTGYRIPSGCRT